MTPAIIFDVIKAADDGTGERKLVFRRTSGGTPAGMTAGGTWVEQVRTAGPETEMGGLACLFFGLPGLCILMLPGDKRMVCRQPRKKRKAGAGGRPCPTARSSPTRRFRRRSPPRTVDATMDDPVAPQGVPCRLHMHIHSYPFRGPAAGRVAVVDSRRPRTTRLARRRRTTCRVSPNAHRRAPDELPGPGPGLPRRRCGRARAASFRRRAARGASAA